MRLLLAIGLFAVSALPASAQVSPPLQLPPTACTSGQLSVESVTSEGAAGTILNTLQLVNIGSVPCTVQGFVTVQMFDAGGTALPTIDVPGGGILARPPGSSPILLAPGAASPFGLAWSDVPVGTETTCPTSATLGITPPSTTTALSLALEISPCGGGTVNVGALRPPGGAVL